MFNTLITTKSIICHEHCYHSSSIKQKKNGKLIIKWENDALTRLNVDRETANYTIPTGLYINHHFTVKLRTAGQPRPPFILIMTSLHNYIWFLRLLAKTNAVMTGHIWTAKTGQKLICPAVPNATTKQYNSINTSSTIYWSRRLGIR